MSSDYSDLEQFFKLRYGDGQVCPRCLQPTQFFRIYGRKSFVCDKCNKQIFPLAGTAFNKTSTPLYKWKYMNQELKKGSSMLAVSREMHLTYKTAWRMGHIIKSLDPSSLEYTFLN